MLKKLHKILPWAAVIFFLVFVGLFVLVSLQHGDTRSESQVTYNSALDVLNEVKSLQADEVTDPRYQTLLTELLDHPYIAALWLISPDGEIVYAAGSTARQGSIQDQMTAEMKRVLDMLPDEALDEEQRLILMAASAVQSEGEHNDIYRHTLREVRSPSGELIGLAAAAYDVNPEINQVSTLYKITLLSLPLVFLIYWLSLPVWVWIDAGLRGEKKWFWAVFVLLGNLAGLLAYLLARIPQKNES